MEYAGYKIEPDTTFPSTYRVKRNGKGSIPTALTGLFTTVKVAKDAIDDTKVKPTKQG